MIRTVTHPATREIHRARRQRARGAWVVMAGLAIALLAAIALGHFGQVSWATLGDALVRTAYRLLFAYAIALVLGAGIGLLVGWSRFADYFFPVFDVLQNVPSFALIPIFIYFLGYTDKMIILFSVSSIVWPILFAVLTAIRTAHSDLNDAATIFGAVGWRRIFDYLFPLAYPAMLTGSVVGIAIGWETVIGAEIIVSAGGFGAFIKSAGASGISETTIAGSLAILTLVFVIN